MNMISCLWEKLMKNCWSNLISHEILYNTTCCLVDPQGSLQTKHSALLQNLSQSNSIWKGNGVFNSGNIVPTKYKKGIQRKISFFVLNRQPHQIFALEIPEAVVLMIFSRPWRSYETQTYGMNFSSHSKCLEKRKILDSSCQSGFWYYLQ